MPAGRPLNEFPPIIRSFRNYLSQAGETQPQHGAVGTESNWFKLGEIELSDGRLWIGDFNFIPSEDDGVIVELTAGRYGVEAKGTDFGGDRRVARLRVVRPGSKPVHGDPLGETWTDTAQTAVGDYPAFCGIAERLGDDDLTELLQAESENGERCGTFQAKQASEATAYFVDSGFGDGTFPVIALTENGQLVGVEIEFISADETYPFGDEEEAEKREEDDGHEQPGASSEVADAFKAMLQQFSGKRTGNPAEDKQMLKGMMDELMNEARQRVVVAMKDFQSHVLQLRRNLPPLRMHWAATDDLGWMSEGKAASLIGAAEEAGFRRVGVYAIEQLAGYRCAAYLDPENSILILVEHSSTYDHIWISTRYPDGTVFQLTDHASNGIGMESWRTVTRRPQNSPAELLAEFPSIRPPTQALRIDDTKLPMMFEGEFVRTQTWRADRGGWTRDELREMKKLGNSPTDEEQLAMHRHDSAEIWLISWLRLQPNLPFDLDRELERLVVIHDDLDAGFLVNNWWRSTHDFDAKERLFEGGNGREVFAKVNADRGNKLKRVLQKTTGLPADFYLPNR